MNIDLTARQVLMSAYLYYQRDENVLSDQENDDNIKLLVDNWEKIPKRYLPLLDPLNEGSKALVATTHHCKYTRLVEAGALAWLEEKKNTKLCPLGHGYYNLRKEEIMARYGHKDHDEAMDVVDAMLYTGDRQESELEELADIFGRWKEKAETDLKDLRDQNSLSLEDLF